MNKQEKITYFMGQIRANIVCLVEQARTSSDDKLYHDLIDLEQFFNTTIDEVFTTLDEPEDAKPQQPSRFGIMVWA